ncbi:riboflavin synthase [Ferrimonas marina]|uniref:Riboflavin synthase n=1 Tax=Ferrimonas marina TaxID=299255 RepID=A0A1M5VZK8_9GAMM|nr:riboflavin synthase [Ferrimonas marina]SHH80373.1 riboflavin synthase alpha chain [Ferrimonas marina]
MFTGIVEAVGALRKLEWRDGDLRVTVATGALPLDDVQLGDSIATNGVCLTVVALGADHFIADVSAETLSLTRFGHYAVGQPVNLERAVTPSTRLGGHLVSGHVDGVATVVSRTARARAVDFWLEAPAALGRYLPHKGSVTIDGISLTLNEVDGARFRLTIVPHTAQQTTLEAAQAGQQVHIEVDLLARYLEKLMQPQADTSSGLTLETLARSGFVK